MSSRAPGTLTLTRDALAAYCCVDLLRAEASGHVSTASGGVWIGAPPEGVSCLSGQPIARFCPFCGAQIVRVHHGGGGGHYWSWHTVPRVGASHVE